MAQVRIERICDHLSKEIKQALRLVVEQVAPDADVNTNALYRAFVKAIARKCNTWEQVPDQYVR